MLYNEHTVPKNLFTVHPNTVSLICASEFYTTMSTQFMLG